jgi:two-component system, chemotaxis family, chemotaxis protein CheY
LSVGRILLIDDNDLIRKMMSRMLASGGYEVQEAANGKVGVACYRKQRSDVVITDILMPEQEGLETIRKLRDVDPKVKIIAISGADEDRARYLDLAVKLGARRTLQKPFTLDDLLTAVGKVLAT